MKLLFILPAFLFSLTAAVDDTFCKNAKVISESFIGKDKNVKVMSLACQELSQSVPTTNVLLPRAASAANLNVCGAPCATNCFVPAGGGPDPNECHVIADALRYESQNTAAIFQVPNGTVAGNPLAMVYRSCKTLFLNQDLGTLEYCRTDWANLVDSVAFNCQSAQNAHGGNCVATDQRWFVQVQSSSAP